MSDSGVVTEPPISSNHFIEEELLTRLTRIGNLSKSHVLVFSGPLMPGTDDSVRDHLEKLKDGDDDKACKKLSVLLTTTGGQVAPVQRIVESIRFHYRDVAFIIPNHAYSAGTILSMSGDRIYMDYYSRLGPIDPQVPAKSGQLVPALGYLRQYQSLVAKAADGTISIAEVQILLGMDQAELYMYDQAVQQSVALLKQWLVQYKFKDWKVTKTRKEPVTEEMKQERAESIALKLSDSDHWHSHGHGISRDVLRDDLKLEIDDLAKPSNLYSSVKQYDRLLADYMMRRSVLLAIHTSKGGLELF